MTYYGFQHSYSANIRDEKCLRIGKVHSFKNQKDRNDWVDEDEYTREEINYREAMKLIDPIYPDIEKH